MNRRTALLMCATAQAAVASLVSIPANAQQSSPIGKKSWIISGSAGLSRSHDDATDQTATFAHLLPTALLFVRPRLAIGGALTLAYSSTSSASFSSIGLGPSARYYFGDMSGQLFPFVSAAVIPVWQESNAKNASSGLPGLRDATNRVITMDGSLGLTRLAATHVGLTGEAYYTRVDNKIEVGSNSQNRKSYDFGFRFGITVFVH